MVLSAWVERPAAYPARKVPSIETLPFESDGLVVDGVWVLPLKPLWLGFAYNWAVFSGAWLGVFLLPQVWRGVRGWRSRHRGHCPACDYDLRGDLTTGCPECGWNWH